MKRRKFIQSSVMGMAAHATLDARINKIHEYMVGKKRITKNNVAAIINNEIYNDITETYKNSRRTLFPTNTPMNKWVKLAAEGFLNPACGVIYRLDRVNGMLGRQRTRPNGMPIGGIDTGCIDLEKNGTLGFISAFNSIVPRRGQLNLPYLGISVGGRTWILADLDNHHYSSIGNKTVFYFAPESKKNGKAKAWTSYDYYQDLDWQVRGVDQIHYWGHYPIVDHEYEISYYTGQKPTEGQKYAEPGKRVKAPVSVGMRAWSPFIPGDVVISQMPGAVFEVHIRNITGMEQSGTLAFSFPGPSMEESEDATSFPRTIVNGGMLSGVSVTNGKDIGYVLGAIGETIRYGGELRANGKAWAEISEKMPGVIDGQAGTSVAVDFRLRANEEKVVRFVLSWYSPRWQGGGSMTAGGRTYTHMYSTHYQSALHVAEILAEKHESLLRRIIAWQEAVYTADEIPVWLRESLVNIFYVITENTLWGIAKPPIGSWCRSEDGLVGMLGDPRNCPWVGGIAEEFYGNIGEVYFFPQMAISTLRAYKAYQNPDGSMRFTYSRTPTAELATDYARQYESSAGGVVYSILIDRFWQMSGNSTILREFYLSLKKSVQFTMNLNHGPNGVISAPTGDVNHGDGFISLLPPGKGLFFGGEHNGVFGMDSHLGGLHLAQLQIAHRMAIKVGDKEFTRQCEGWIQAGSESLEQKMWTGSYYLNYWEPETGNKSNLVYAYQLEGECIARSHGLPGVFNSDRVKKTLKTILDVNGSLTSYGAIMFATPQGKTVGNAKFNIDATAAYGDYSIFVGDSIILAATYMHSGDIENGMIIIKKLWEDIVCKQGYTWEQPNLIRGDTGEITFGWDFYQNLGLWMLPAAIENKNLSESVKPGTLVDRVIRAGCGYGYHDMMRRGWA